MDIKEVKTLKVNLKKRINLLLLQFTEETGLDINGIKCGYPGILKQGGKIIDYGVEIDTNL